MKESDWILIYWFSHLEIKVTSSATLFPFFILLEILSYFLIQGTFLHTQKILMSLLVVLFLGKPAPLSCNLFCSSTFLSLGTSPPPQVLLLLTMKVFGMDVKFPLSPLGGYYCTLPCINYSLWLEIELNYYSF